MRMTASGWEKERHQEDHRHSQADKRGTGNDTQSSLLQIVTKAGFE